MKDWLKRLFCTHSYVWFSNIYGDEINFCGGNRSKWKCIICGKITYFKGYVP